MTIGRYVEIQEVLGTEWCQRAVKTGLLLIQLGWMTKEEYEAYWKINSYFTYTKNDDNGRALLFAYIDTLIDEFAKEGKKKRLSEEIGE